MWTAEQSKVTVFMQKWLFVVTGSIIENEETKLEVREIQTVLYKIKSI